MTVVAWSGEGRQCLYACAAGRRADHETRAREREPCASRLAIPGHRSASQSRFSISKAIGAALSVSNSSEATPAGQGGKPWGPPQNSGKADMDLCPARSFAEPTERRAPSVDRALPPLKPSFPRVRSSRTAPRVDVRHTRRELRGEVVPTPTRAWA